MIYRVRETLDHDFVVEQKNKFGSWFRVAGPFPTRAQAETYLRIEQES